MTRAAFEVLPFFVLPFVLLFWMAPFVSETTIGNDYQRYAIESQIDLFFSIATGSFPLYAPGYYIGQTSSALPLGEAYHPISHLASILPGYWEGGALELNTLLRFLELGLCHWLLFRFLRGVNLTTPIAFLISMVTVYNLKMLDLFRYGASLETWCGHVMLCAGIGLHWLKPTRPRALLVIVATYLLICSGHPQMMYFGLVGAGLFTLAVPFVVAEMVPGRWVERAALARFYGSIGLCCAVGIALSSAYLAPFYFDFLGYNSDRTKNTYEWAARLTDSQMGIWSSFFVPLRSAVSGAFGGSTLMLVGLLAPLLRVFRVRVPAVLWALSAALAVTYLAMLGKRTPVHHWMWETLPLFSSFRIPSRISLYVPVLLMLLLAWVFRRDARAIELGRGRLRLAPPSLLAGVAFLLQVVYWVLPESVVLNIRITSPAMIRQIPGWVAPAVSSLGALAFATLVLRGFFRRREVAIDVALCGLAAAQIMVVLYFGTWVAPRPQTPSLVQMHAYKKESLEWRFAHGGGMYSNALPPPWIFKRLPREEYFARIVRDPLFVDTREQVFALMLEMKKGERPKQLILEGEPFEIEAGRGASTAVSDSVDLVFSSYNRLVFDVAASRPGLLTLYYPHTGHWKAWVDDERAVLHRADGYFHAVEIDAGRSRVEYRYESRAAIAGMAISCAVFALVAIWASGGVRPLPRRIAIAALASATAAFVFVSWYGSLYRGENLGTGFHWDTGLESGGARDARDPKGRRSIGGPGPRDPRARHITSSREVPSR